MIIIIEGIDRVGKTTLVDKIEKGCEIRPFRDSFLSFSYLDFNKGLVSVSRDSRSDIIANTEKINTLISFFEQYPDRVGDIVLDRFHLSEYVYGMIDRKYLSLEAFYSFDDRLAKLDAIIVYVEPKDLEWSSKQHGSSLKNHLHFFEHAVRQSSCEVIRCNFDTLDEVVLNLKRRIANDTCI